MKTNLLASCLAAVASVAFVGVASATSFNYVDVEVPLGVSGNLSGTGQNAATFSDNTIAGQIKLTAQTGSPVNDRYVWCLDVFDTIYLGSSGTFNLITPLLAGPVPHANSSLSTFQIQQIGALAYFGDLVRSNGLLTTAQKDLDSAAAQLAIWKIEYGPYGAGVSFSDAAVTAQALIDLGNVSTLTSSWLNGFSYIVTLYQNTNNAVQDLGLSSQQTTALLTPLPGALPLFVSGLAGIGGVFGWRRKRKASAAAAA